MLRITFRAHGLREHVRTTQVACICASGTYKRGRMCACGTIRALLHVSFAPAEVTPDWR